MAFHELKNVLMKYFALPKVNYRVLADGVSDIGYLIYYAGEHAFTVTVVPGGYLLGDQIVSLEHLDDLISMKIQMLKGEHEAKDKGQGQYKKGWQDAVKWMRTGGKQLSIFDEDVNHGR
jgi:hypothetical protein